ncbi:MAG: sporulation domain-containing protein [Streptosporangiales bacterium]|nr:sporulation domain-containing protein [Streptosporangiales bacterium]
MAVRRPSLIISVSAVVGLVTGLLSVPARAPLAGAGASGAAARLPLGAPGLPEVRHERRLAPGVTLTTVVRGRLSPGDRWTLTVPVQPGRPGDDRDLGPPAAAQAMAERVRKAGLEPRIEPVTPPRRTDLGTPTVEYGVRVGLYRDAAAARADRDRLAHAGLRPAFRMVDREGAPTTGPWRVAVLTVDPEAFHGSVVAELGDSVRDPEKVTETARRTAAVAAVNGGFFVQHDADGAPGDPVGIAVSRGRLLSEAVAGAPALVLRADGRPSIAELATTGEVRMGSALRELDGVNREPGKIVGCGGRGGDRPTERPLRETCTDDSELISYTPEYGPRTPGGDGTEAVIGADGRVIDVRERGGTIPAGGSVLAGTGSAAAWLREPGHSGTAVTVRHGITGPRGRPYAIGPRDSVVSGGPRLVTGGRVLVEARASGLASDDPGYSYLGLVRRDPRTMAGIDAYGRLLLVTVDGRDGQSVGVSFTEGAELMRSLGAVEALNLDGGGSTTMAVGGRLLNRPSEEKGERAVGEALLVLPAR